MVLAKDREKLIQHIFLIHTGINRRKYNRTNKNILGIPLEETITEVVLPVFKSPLAIQQIISFKW